MVTQNGESKHLRVYPYESVWVTIHKVGKWHRSELVHKQVRVLLRVSLSNLALILLIDSTMMDFPLGKSQITSKNPGDSRSSSFDRHFNFSSFQRLQDTSHLTLSLDWLRGMLQETSILDGSNHDFWLRFSLSIWYPLAIWHSYRKSSLLKR